MLPTFGGAYEAKQYLVSEILLEADRQGVPLTDVEKKMMYFSELHWTPKDIFEVSEIFERDYEAGTYETKIGTLCQMAQARLKSNNSSGFEKWRSAVRILRKEDHYLLVMIDASPMPVSSRAADRMKLIATALLITLVLIGIVIFFLRGNDPLLAH